MLSWNLKFFNALNWWPQKKSALKYKKMKWASKVFSPLEILINEVQDFYQLSKKPNHNGKTLVLFCI